jgi:hypothetical protein
MPVCFRNGGRNSAPRPSGGTVVTLLLGFVAELAEPMENSLAVEDDCFG